jgi:ABC-type lipoprotein export system ATPase subunit
VAALAGLDLRVERGELAAIVGPSGSGKSTMLRLLAGLDRPSAGRLTVFEMDVHNADERALALHRSTVVGLVDQQYWRSISPYLTARATIELPLELRGWPAAARHARSEELLGRIGLRDRAEARPAELSGGEQQRVAFAAAVAARPRLLLADEPTGELDERTATELLGSIRDLIRAEQVTAVLVTHDPLVESVADRIIDMRDGRAIAVRDLQGERRVVDRAGWTAPPRPDRPAPPAAAARPDLRASAVRLTGVQRIYGHARARVAALEGIDVTFRSGGLHAVVGPSGSGKSTLLRLVGGLDRPTSGRVETLGVDLATLDRAGLARLRAERIGLVSQSPRLVPFLDALENVELGSAISPPTHAGRRSAAIDALRAVGLADLAGRRPDELSAGERMRVALARAMAGGPELLILDEPTATLDRASASGVIGLLADLDHGVTVLVATHDRDLIAAASDRFDLRDARRAAPSPA